MATWCSEWISIHFVYTFDHSDWSIRRMCTKNLSIFALVGGKSLYVSGAVQTDVGNEIFISGIQNWHVYDSFHLEPHGSEILIFCDFSPKS